MFVGIADCDGLDTLVPGEEKWNFLHMDMRCRFNSHRHPLIFRVFLTEQHAITLKSLWHAQKYKLAHEHIKAHASIIEVATPREPWANSNQERWDSIPTYPRSKRPTYNNPTEVQQLSLGFEEEEENGS